MRRAGYFTGGSYTPTWLQALTAYGTCEPYFTLSEAQMMFLEGHPELEKGPRGNNGTGGD